MVVQEQLTLGTGIFIEIKMKEGACSGKTVWQESEGQSLGCEGSGLIWSDPAKVTAGKIQSSINP